jgi:phage shock protein A
MDWTQLGTNVGLILGGVGAFFAGRGQRQVGQAADQAAVSEYKADATVTDAAAAQVKQLIDRVESLENKYSKLWDDLQAEKQASSKLRDRVRQLEGILRDNNITVPAEA